MKLLRTIRLDPSDTFVFERAAEPGEWAISGSFLFLETDPETLNTKQKHALRSGFLGAGTLGFSTLVTIAETTDSERDAAIDQLAQAFVETLGAPDLASARHAAVEEFRYAASLCNHPINTLIAVQRHFDESGALREQFRTLRPREADENQDRLHAFARAFTFHETEENENDAPEDKVDLLSLSTSKAADLK